MHHICHHGPDGKKATCFRWDRVARIIKPWTFHLRGHLGLVVCPLPLKWKVLGTSPGTILPNFKLATFFPSLPSLQSEITCLQPLNICKLESVGSSPNKTKCQDMTSYVESGVKHKTTFKLFKKCICNPIANMVALLINYCNFI